VTETTIEKGAKAANVNGSVWPTQSWFPCQWVDRSYKTL
jgi:hypothetical protein